MFPARLLLIFNFSKIWLNKQTVVDFPFVPVTPIYFSSGLNLKNNSISFNISILSFSALFKIICLFFPTLKNLIYRIFLSSYFLEMNDSYVY